MHTWSPRLVPLFLSPPEPSEEEGSGPIQRMEQTEVQSSRLKSHLAVSQDTEKQGSREQDGPGECPSQGHSLPRAPGSRCPGINNRAKNRLVHLEDSG